MAAFTTLMLSILVIDANLTYSTPHQNQEKTPPHLLHTRYLIPALIILRQEIQQKTWFIIIIVVVLTRKTHRIWPLDLKQLKTRLLKMPRLIFWGRVIVWLGWSLFSKKCFQKFNHPNFTMSSSFFLSHDALCTNH